MERTRSYGCWFGRRDILSDNRSAWVQKKGFVEALPAKSVATLGGNTSHQEIHADWADQLQWFFFAQASFAPKKRYFFIDLRLTFQFFGSPGVPLFFISLPQTFPDLAQPDDTTLSLTAHQPLKPKQSLLMIFSPLHPFPKQGARPTQPIFYGQNAFCSHTKALFQTLTFCSYFILIYANQQQLLMEKHNKKKIISMKKIDDILQHQELIKQDKHFSPGLVEFSNSDRCTGRVVNFFGDIHTEVFSVRVDSNDKAVGVGCSNGQAKVYDIYEGKVLSITNTSRMSGFPCTSIRWKPITTDDYVASNCDGTIKWYNKNQETAYGHFQRNEVSYLCSDYQIKEEWCIFGTDLNTIEVFDNTTMKMTQNYEAGGPEELGFNHHTNRVFCVKCLPKDPFVFFSGGWDSTVQIWDVRVGNGSVRKICGPSVSSDSLDFKDGRLLAGNYQNNNIAQTYDYGSGELIETLDINQPPNSNSYCFAASFAHRSQHNLIAVGLTGSNKVKLLKDNKLACEMKFQAAPLSLDFYRLNNKDFIVVGGIQGTIYCIKLDFHK